jgi:hypothetical protein
LAIKSGFFMPCARHADMNYHIDLIKKQAI